MRTYNPWLHRFAILTAGATFILIFMGGLVTSTDSGLAVPDWPTTFGYNMFLYPLSKTVSGFLFSIDPNLQAHLDEAFLSIDLRSALERNEISVSKNVEISVADRGHRWRVTDANHQRVYTIIKTNDGLDVYVHGVLYEHTHRLIGSVVGVLIIVLMLMIWAKDSRQWMKWLSIVALAAVVGQGIMGGLRVEHLSRSLAVVHACFAQAFFALTASLVLFTSRGWREAPMENDTVDTSRLGWLSIITVALIYIQIIFGAVLRHTGVRLDAHLFLAFFVTINVFFLTRKVWSDFRGRRALVRPVLLLSGLLALQLVLGMAAFFVELTALNASVTVTTRVSITTAHLAVGALMLVISVIFALRIFQCMAMSTTKPELMHEEVST